MRRIETEEWWEELVELKDDLSLRELSARFKVTPGAISNALRRNHLVRKAAPSGPRAYRTSLTANQDERLPPEPGEVSNDSGLPRVRPGSKDYLLQPAFHLLGKIPDAEVARRCAVSVRTVASYRARHNIPGYSGPRKKGTKTPPRMNKAQVFRNRRATDSPNAAGRWAGVSQQAARQYGASTTAGTKRDVGQATPNAVSVDFAWLVRFSVGGGEVERVLVGSRLTEVASTAAGLGLGEVLSVVRVGQLHQG